MTDDFTMLIQDEEDEVTAPALPSAGDDDGLRCFSYGGGVQSTAALVLAAKGLIDFKTFLFSNVGDDSEHPVSVWYVRNIAVPFGAAHGIGVHELHRIRRDGTIETLWGRLMKEGSRSLPIPVRMDNGAPGTRSCTADFKIKVVGKWLKQHGANKDKRAIVGIGISTDEIQRVNARRAMPYEVPVYPLIDMPAGVGHGRTYNRSDCQKLIRDAELPAELASSLRSYDWASSHPDPEYAALIEAEVRPQLEANNYTRLPVPPKSSCFFCPFHRPSTWQAMRQDEPVLFRKSVELEGVLNERREMLGKDKVWLTRFAKPLEDAVPESVSMFDFAGDSTDAECDNGVCWT